MAKTGITIAISGTYNGRALEKARKDLEKLRINAVSEMGGAGSALVNFGAKAAELGGEMHNLGYKMEQVGSAATKGITLPIIAAATACGAAAVEMDTALTSVKKTVDGTEQQYQDLKQAAIEFSKTNAVSASQIMEIQSLGAQLGFAIEELDEFGRVVSGLDIATNMDAETAATELAQFANITKMAHFEISNYGSAIVGLGNNMATTESDISHMAMRIAAAGTQVGMTQADILGLSAALASMGIQAEAGGTAISTIMSQIDKDVALGSKGLKTWAETAGMTADQFVKAWKDDPVQALAALLSNMEKATTEGSNMAVMLDELGISSLRQTDVMKRLAGNSELVTKAVSLSNDEWRKNTALQNEVDNRNASMAARLEMLKNKVVAVADQVGTPLVNALLEVVDASDPLIQAVADVAQGFADMDKDSQRMVLGLVAAAAAFGPVMTVGGKYVQLLGNIVTGVGKASQHLGVFINDLSKAKTTFADVKNVTNDTSKSLKYAATEMSGMSKACGVLKASLGAIGITAAVAAIGFLVSKLAEWVDHNNKVKKATEGLETAIDAANEAYSSYTYQVEGAIKSLGDIKAKTDEVLSAQSELADSMREQWSDYGTNAAMVDAYAKEIQELTNKFDENGNKVQLNATEQERLKLAVENFNEMANGSIEVVDALTGTLDTQIDVIMANAAAFKEQARQQAAMEMYKDLYKQQIEDEMALNEATKTLNDLKKKEAEAWEWCVDGINPYTDQVNDAQRQVDELSSALDSNVKAQEGVIDILTNSTKKFDKFEDALNEAGVSLSDFGELTEDQLKILKDSFDGSLESIVNSCKDAGVQCPVQLAKAVNENSPKPEQAIANTCTNMQTTVGKLPSAFSNTGSRAVSSLVSSITSKASDVYSASNTLSASAQNGINPVVTKFNSTALNAAGSFIKAIGKSSAYGEGRNLGNSATNGIGSVSAYGTGINFIAGFVNGMVARKVYSAAYNIGISALSGIKNALGIASPSKEAIKVGEFFGEGAVIGMRSTEADLMAESKRMSQAMSLDPFQNKYGNSFYGNNYGVNSPLSRQISLNMTINVNTQNAAQAANIGKSVADNLYLELERLERSRV